MPRILMAAYTNYRRDPRVRREAEALVAIGHEVVFLASAQPGEPDRETVAGVEVVKLRRLHHDRTSMLAYLADYLLFFVLLASHLTLHPLRYRLIHINNMPDFLVFAAWLPRLLGRPVIHDVHDLMPELYGEKFAGRRRWLIPLLECQERLAGRFASAVLTVEERLKDILSRRGIPRTKIHVLMNLPDPRVFGSRAAPRAKPEHASLVLVYHGTLARRLGLDIAIEAVGLARASLPRLELRIIGDGEERAGLLALRDRLGLQAHVHFSDGFVPVERIAGLLADADIGIVPLRISPGTDIMLPTKLLEYVSLGIPCIVPRTGTIERYFDAEMVEFFTAEDAGSLAEAIVGLGQDPQRRAQLALAATQRFARRFGWAEHQKVYTELVGKLLRPKGSARLTPDPGA